MKILILSEFFPYSDKIEITGGVEARAYHIAQELAKNHDVFVFTSLRNGQKSTFQFNNINIIRFGPSYKYSNFSNLFQRILFNLNCIIKGRKYIKNNSIEIIDGYNFFTYFPAMLLGFGKKVFLTYHEVWIGNWIKNTGRVAGIIGEISERVLLLLARMLKVRFISVSDFTKQKLIECGINKKNIRVIPNGINPLVYERTVIKKYKHPTLCYIGRLTKQKRVDNIIKALLIIKEKYPDIKLIIVGKGQEADNLIELTKQIKISNNVEFLGFVKEYQKVIEILKKSHIFCSASTVEGFGIVLIESIACKVPYVCSNIDPFIEVSENGKGGLLFNIKNYKDFAKKVLALLNNQDLYATKVKEGTELIKKYKWKNIVQKIEDFYKS